MKWLRRRLRHIFCLLFPFSLFFWGVAVHFHWCSDFLSLRGYLALRCGWFRTPASSQIHSRVKQCVVSGDVRLGLITLDLYSRIEDEDELKSMASFFAGCCAQKLGDSSDALVLWSRTMEQFPCTRGGLWSRRAAEWLLNAHERRWVI